jgi:hypothetical protein
LIPEQNFQPNFSAHINQRPFLADTTGEALLPPIYTNAYHYYTHTNYEK